MQRQPRSLNLFIRGVLFDVFFTRSLLISMCLEIRKIICIIHLVEMLNAEPTSLNWTDLLRFSKGHYEWLVILYATHSSYASMELSQCVRVWPVSIEQQIFFNRIMCEFYCEVNNNDARVSAINFLSFFFFSWNLHFVRSVACCCFVCLKILIMARYLVLRVA